MKRLFLGSWIKVYSLSPAVLTAVVFLKVASVLAAELVVFRPAYAPAPADNSLKGGRPFRFANVDAEPLRPGWFTLGKIVIP